jgi:transcriptional regulator with XRE-family HTH domain
MYSIRKSIGIACAKKGIMRKDLAQLAGVSIGQLQTWQRTNGITMTSCQNLANALEMSLSEFIALGEC